jgi:hypothetical protein
MLRASKLHRLTRRDARRAGLHIVRPVAPAVETTLDRLLGVVGIRRQVALLVLAAAHDAARS